MFKVRVNYEGGTELFDIKAETTIGAIKEALKQANLSMRRRSCYRPVVSVFIEFTWKPSEQRKDG